MTRTLMLLAALAITASPALAECPDPWPPQAATQEQVRAALGVVPCSLDNTRPLRTADERLAAKKIEAEERELDVRIAAAESALRTNNWKYFVSIWK